MFEGTVDDAKKAGIELTDHAAARVQELLKNDVPPLVESIRGMGLSLIDHASGTMRDVIDHAIGQLNGWVVNIPPIRIGKGK